MYHKIKYPRLLIPSTKKKKIIEDLIVDFLNLNEKLTLTDSPAFRMIFFLNEKYTF